MRKARIAGLAALAAILVLSTAALGAVSGNVGFNCANGVLGERTRVLAGTEAQASDVSLPLEGFAFRITVTQGASATLVVVPPSGAFDPSNPEAFVDDQGQARDILWLARNPQTGLWADTGAPVSVDVGLSRLTVTLTDGGAGDMDGGPNGVISVGQAVDHGDAGAPGFSGYVQPPVMPTGSIRAVLEPTEAVAAGAAWRVDGWGWLASGVTQDGLGVGTHYVEFQDATGYDAPGAANVAVTEGLTTDRTYTYTAQVPAAEAGGCETAPAPFWLLPLVLIPWVMAGRKH
jgi:hypothetical protein